METGMTITRKILCRILCFFALSLPLCAQEGGVEDGASVDTGNAESGTVLSAEAGDAEENAATSETLVPAAVANNEYLRTAWRFSNLARLAIQDGE
jgi:hypothetical protein